MKTTFIAVMALLGSASAVRVRDFIDEDEQEIQMTAESIAHAEQAHGYKFQGLSNRRSDIGISFLLGRTNNLKVCFGNSSPGFR